MSTSQFQQYATRLSAHIGFLFTELPFVDRITAAKKIGFKAVEHPQPFATTAPLLKKLLNEAGLPLVQTAFPSGDMARGEKGFAALPDFAARFRATVEPTLDYVEAIGCRLVHAMAGIRPADVAHEKLWETYLENISFAADAAAKRGISILIEPIGPGSIANYIIDDPHVAMNAVKGVNRANVGLLMDAFHCESLGYDPVKLIREYGSYIRHAQIADHPGRHEPGSGSMNFDAILKSLTEVGYQGFVGCEYHPSSSTEASLSWFPGQNRNSNQPGSILTGAK
jgi:hydroxypyruvate isomerase